MPGLPRAGFFMALLLGGLLSPLGASGTTPGFPPLILSVKVEGGESEPFYGGCSWDATVALRGSVFLSVCRPGFFESKGPYQIAISRTPFKSLTVIAQDDAPVAEPRISPNGKWVVFAVLPESGPPALEVVRADGTGRRVLSSGYSSAIWASDSQRLLATNDATGNLDVLDLRTHTRVFAPGSSAAWQPHGQLVGYVGPGGRLIVSRADGSGRRVFGPTQLNTLEWSPDGRTLAYVSDSDRFAHGLLTLDVRSHKTRLLAAAASARPTWSPDGGRLAVIAAPKPTSFIGIYTVTRTGKRTAPVFYPGGHSLLSVSWTRNRRIVFGLG